MPDLKIRLIETAVRPLADDAEMKLAAAHLLGEMAANPKKGAEEAIQRWDAVDAKKHKSAWRIVLWVPLVAVSAGVAIRDFREVVRYVKWIKWAHGFSIFSMSPLPVAEPNRECTARQKLLLFGDPSKSSNSEKKEALWQSEPENIAYFAEYVAAYATDNNCMPPDWREITQRMDPENAWFTYQAAALEARDAVKGNPRKSRKVDGVFVYEQPKSWTILDQGRLDRTLMLIREARAQPKWDDYSAGLLMERISLLPQRNFIERMDMASILSGNMTSASIRLRIVAGIIAERAWSTGEAGDVAGFRDIGKDGEHFIRGLSDRETGTLVDELVATVCVSDISESFAAAAGKLGLEEEATHWKQISARLTDRKNKRNSHQLIVDGKAVEADEVAGGLFGGSIEMVAKQAEHQPPLTDGDLKPGRLFEHDLLSRFCSYVLWVLMGVCLAFVAAYRFRVSRLANRLAGRIEELLKTQDWCWVMGAGVLLPFAFVIAVNRLTPLGGRQFGAAGNSLMLPTVHFLGLMMLWLIVPAQVIGWRLTNRAGVLGFPKKSWWGWLAVICAATFVPVISWAVLSQSFTGFWDIWIEEVEAVKIDPANSPVLFYMAVGILGISVLWVILQISSAIFSRPNRLIWRATSALVLVRVYAAAMLLLALATVAFKASEQYWFNRDTISMADPSQPGWSRYEYQVAMQMRKELREILGAE